MMDISTTNCLVDTDPVAGGVWALGISRGDSVLDRARLTISHLGSHSVCEARCQVKDVSDLLRVIVKVEMRVKD